VNRYKGLRLAGDRRVRSRR